MKCWLITHSDNGAFLRLELFKAHEELSSADECHCTRDASAVYTYLHFRRHVAREALVGLLASLKEVAGIVVQDVFGSDDAMADHVGFRVLLRHYQTRSAAFRPCTDGRPEVTRGLLWRSDSLARIRRMTRQRGRRLAGFFQSMEQELAAYKKRAELVDLMRGQLSEYEAVMERRGSIMQAQREQLREFWRLHFVTHVLRARIHSLEPAQQEMMLAPDHSGRPLFS